MTLTAADVAEIMRLVEQSSFDELTLELNGLKLTLRRGAAAEQVNGAAALNSAPGAVGGTAANVPRSSAATGTNSRPGSVGAAAVLVPTQASQPARADPSVHEVTTPLLGTFYRAPKPGAPPFVEVGSVVEEDTVVAIIEVMKLMNSVRAGVRGTVSEILARDGALVEYGETVLRVRKAS